MSLVLDESATVGRAFDDAAYLELARREGVPLARLDRELASAARAEGVALPGEN